MSILKVEGLTYIYGEGTPFRIAAITDVNFEINSPGLTAIIGHTGSGKSTLIQHLNGLIKTEPGHVFVDDVDIWANEKEIRDVRFKVGLVFQYPEYQLFEETVEKDIAYGPKNMGLSEDEIAKRVEEAASFVGLDRALLEKSPFDLSGGQKRRVAIAGIIAMRPEVLILDEPASGLDPIGRSAIFDGLVRYRDNTGAAVVIVSHSMEDMAKYAEDIVVLAKDKLVLNGSRDEVFSHAELLIKNSLDVPDIARLAQKLREKGLPLPENLYTVEDTKNAILRLFEGRVPRD